MTYYFMRFKKSSIWLSFVFILIVMVLQYIISIRPILVFLNPSEMTHLPYTEWLLMDPILSIAFSLVLPILTALGSGLLFLEDKESGLLNKLLLNKGKVKYFSQTYFYSFLVGAFFTFISLLLFVLMAFALLPDLKPDVFFNSNINMNAEVTYFLRYFFTAPKLHILCYLIINSIFGGLFSLITLTCSVFNTKVFSVLVSSFLLVLILAIVSMAIGDPLSPVFFLAEESTMYLPSFEWFAIGTFSVFLIVTLIYGYGVKRNGTE